MEYALKQSTSAHPLLFRLRLSSDHYSPATGKSPTVTLSKAGAAFGAPAGAVTELGSGWYQVAGNTTDTATLGPLLLHAVEAASDPADYTYFVQSTDPDTAALNANDSPNLQTGTAQAGAAQTVTLAAAASAVDSTYNGSLLSIVSGTGAGQGRVIVGYAGSTKVATLSRAWITNPDSTSVYVVLKGQWLTMDSVLAPAQQTADSLRMRASTAQAGAATTITLDAGASAVDGYYTGQTCRLYQGTGAFQARRILSYVGSTKVATVDTAWATTPDSTTLFSILAPLGPATNSTLQVTAASVQGAVTGSVASVTAGVTVTTNNDKTGYALSAAGVQAVWDALTSALTTVGSLGKLLVDNINATISSRNATAPDNTSIATILTRADVATSTRASATDYTTARAAKLDNLDTTISSRGTSTYAGGAVASVSGAVGSVTGNVGGNVTGSVGSVLGAVGSVTGAVTTTDTANVTAIKAKTDALPSDPASNTEVDTRLATTGYTAPPSAATVAAAVWDRLTSALTTASSIGAYLIAKLTAPSLTITSVAAATGALTLIRGDDYSATDNRALTLRITTGDDLSGGGLTATLALGDAVLTLTGGTVTLVSDTTWDLTWHPTAAQTALLVQHSYRYQAWVLRSTRVLTEAYGTCTVYP